MDAKPVRRGRRTADKSVNPATVKVTLRLSELTAKRLGVEAVMTGEGISQIADRVLSAYLSAWRLPSKVGGIPAPHINLTDGAEDES